jgi:hypothetical protein
MSELPDAVITAHGGLDRWNVEVRTWEVARRRRPTANEETR